MEAPGPAAIVEANSGCGDAGGKYCPLPAASEDETLKCAPPGPGGGQGVPSLPDAGIVGMIPCGRPCGNAPPPRRAGITPCAGKGTSQAALAMVRSSLLALPVSR